MNTTTTTAAPGATPAPQPQSSAGDHLVPVSAAALHTVYRQLDDAVNALGDLGCVLRAISSMICGDGLHTDEQMGMVTREQTIAVFGHFADRVSALGQDVNLVRRNVHPYFVASRGQP